jgi:hypothetical protein
MSAEVVVEERNSYLALRDAKIARNHARLQELGLASTNLNKRVGSSAIAVVQTAAKKMKSVTNEKVEPKRRSLRTNIKVINFEAEPERTPKAIARSSRNLTKSESDTAHRKQAVTTKNSAREMDLDIEVLLFGKSNENCTTGVLGIKLETTGKAFVIEESARRAVRNVYATPISFNKYCGAQEWRNAMYLWINFDSPGSEVVNSFFSNGHQVNWFGGSKMHDGTPLIQRLKRLGDQAAQQKKKPSDEAVILWCRKYNAEKKGFDPYVCFGRLSVRLLQLFINLNIRIYGAKMCLF